MNASPGAVVVGIDDVTDDGCPKHSSPLTEGSGQGLKACAQHEPKAPCGCPAAGRPGLQTKEGERQ